ncbi:MAG: hypothetical protein CO036_00195 [Candidatus Omnitrophica bacterium CG_4_9_14_0_2_um_filter_43_12]|nr:MAG: hypothetical protein CO036_00195 [Candidatus Omnitrophica bacterium CG_4_9_14_0_2_um_filter_43_12]
MISLKSKVTGKLLNYFFINPKESLYVNELVKNLELDKRNLVKKLNELEKGGILTRQKRGNLKLYGINEKYPLYAEYKKIVLKTIGFEDRLKKIMDATTNIKEVYIYGSYARDKMDVHSDIDLLVVGDHSIAFLQKRLNKFQKEINREINVVNMDENEFKKRIKNKDPFISQVLKTKYIRIKL